MLGKRTLEMGLMMFTIPLPNNVMCSVSTIVNGSNVSCCVDSIMLSLVVSSHTVSSLICQSNFIDSLFLVKSILHWYLSTPLISVLV